MQPIQIRVLDLDRFYYEEERAGGTVQVIPSPGAIDRSGSRPDSTTLISQKPRGARYGWITTVRRW